MEAVRAALICAAAALICSFMPRQEMHIALKISQSKTFLLTIRNQNVTYLTFRHRLKWRH